MRVARPWELLADRPAWCPVNARALGTVLRPAELLGLVRWWLRPEDGATASRELRRTSDVLETVRTRISERAGGIISVEDAGDQVDLAAELVRWAVGTEVRHVVLSCTDAVVLEAVRLRLHPIPVAHWPPVKDERVAAGHPAAIASTPPDEASTPPAEKVRGPGCLVILLAADYGFRGEHGFSLRQRFAGSSVLALTTLGAKGMPTALLHAYADLRDEEGILAQVAGRGPRVPLEVRWLPGWARKGGAAEQAVDQVKQWWSDQGEQAEDPRRWRGLWLVPHGREDLALEPMRRAGLPCHDGTAWGEAGEGWSLLAGDGGGAMVVRGSLPAWAPISDLDVVVVSRPVGPTTAARLTAMLRRPRSGKAGALLLLDRSVADDVVWMGFLADEDQSGGRTQGGPPRS